MSTSTEALAKERVVLSLFKLYRYLDGKSDRALTSMYLEPLAPYPVQAAQAAWETIRNGDVPEAVEWLPSIPRWIGLVRAFNRRYEPPVLLYNGNLNMDFGHGKIDLRGLTPAEQDSIINAHGFIGGKNAAMMSLDDKREAIRNPAITTDKTRPLIKRMSDK